MPEAVASTKHVDFSEATLFKVTGSTGSTFDIKHGLGRIPAFVIAWAEGTAGDICTVTAKDASKISVTITNGSTGYVLVFSVYG